ncbi:uncharacterized protein LOC142982898 [Anticarsia gemmatalis]|uniref:uncharacterized protein LOC142982898 n=1 Tax=Anticarsia gemmatalis TaxID=129554 RepID=UPI003F75FCE4
MRNSILFVVFAVIALYVSAAVIDPEESLVEEAQFEDLNEEYGYEEDAAVEDVPIGVRFPSYLFLGSVNVGNMLCLRRYFNMPAVPSVAHTQSFVYTNSTCRITAVVVSEGALRMAPRVRTTAGGLNSNTVTLQFSSARGGGYHYLVEIWGTRV